MMYDVVSYTRHVHIYLESSFSREKTLLKGSTRKLYQQKNHYSILCNVFLQRLQKLPLDSNISTSESTNIFEKTL